MLNPKIFIVIPTYNEERNINKVIGSLISGGYKNIVVVEDGSKDNTFNILLGEEKKNRIFLLNHITNRGQGAALKTGIDFALARGAEIIVTFDADGQHQVSDLQKLIEPVAKEEVEVVLGSRFLEKKSNVPFGRKVLLKGSIIVTFLVYGIKLTDVHNGLRALSRDAAMKIEIKTNGMEHASEILDEIHKKDILFKEVPVTVRYTKETLKHGHGSLIGALKIFYKMVIKKLIS